MKSSLNPAFSSEVYALPPTNQRKYTITCRYRRDPSWTLPPPNQKIRPILSVQEKEFCEQPSLVNDDNPLARAILLTDGHLSQLLSCLPEDADDLLYMHQVDTTIPSKSTLPHSPPMSTSHCIYPLTPVRRTVSFHDTSNQRGYKLKHRPVCLNGHGMLLYSTSVWCPNMFHYLMLDPEDNRHLPDWMVFERHSLQLARCVVSVHYGTNPSIAKSFGFPPMTLLWARDIVYYRKQRPFLYVHEILSPTLEKYVGSMKPPLSSVSDLNFPPSMKVYHQLLQAKHHQFLDV